MDENEVIAHLCRYLTGKGWTISSSVAAGAPGIDIIAKDTDGTVVYIEAKGGTSSNPGSNRYGKPYTQTQVFDVTSKGVMQCLHHIANEGSTVRVAFAFPAGRFFDRYMKPIRPLLLQVGLSLFQVNADGSVTEANAAPV